MKFVNCLNKIHTTVPLEGSEEDRMLQACELKLNPNNDNYPHDEMPTVMNGMNADSNCCLEKNSQILQQTVKRMNVLN